MEEYGTQTLGRINGEAIVPNRNPSEYNKQ
jgi:hypothetical protein